MHWKEHAASYHGIKLQKHIISFTPLHLLILLDFSPVFGQKAAVLVRPQVSYPCRGSDQTEKLRSSDQTET